MKKIHIFNPAAGKNAKLPKGLTDTVYITKDVGDAENFVYNISRSENIHFVVHGGDGTINEVANGIIKADAGHRCLISVMPKGTGNDFVRSALEDSRIHNIDAIRFNDSYCINSLNTGIDLRVVEECNKFKRFPLVRGSLAYLLGVIAALFKGIGERWIVALETEDGKRETFENEEFSLALFANGSFYGGGFKAAPLASLSDGLIDVILVRKVSKLTFLKLVLAYRAGKHFENGRVADKFKDYLIYRRCVRVELKNINNICSDGEIFRADRVEISIVKDALQYI